MGGIHCIVCKTMVYNGCVLCRRQERGKGEFLPSQNENLMTRGIYLNRKLWFSWFGSNVESNGGSKVGNNVGMTE